MQTSSDSIDTVHSISGGSSAREHIPVPTASPLPLVDLWQNVDGMEEEPFDAPVSHHDDNQAGNRSPSSRYTLGDGRDYSFGTSFGDVLGDMRFYIPGSFFPKDDNSLFVQLGGSSTDMERS
jgi:hypothetical protein